MGPLNRFLTKTFHLRPHDLANLSFLYFATFVMRAAAFAGVAVMQHAMSSLDSFWKGVLFAVYPLAEITTVGYFGALCDRLGRKRILVLAHFVTAVARSEERRVGKECSSRSWRCHGRVDSIDN